jgi:hypothetical protein
VPLLASGGQPSFPLPLESVRVRVLSPIPPLSLACCLLMHAGGGPHAKASGIVNRPSSRYHLLNTASATPYSRLVHPAFPESSLVLPCSHRGLLRGGGKSTRNCVGIRGRGRVGRIEWGLTVGRGQESNNTGRKRTSRSTTMIQFRCRKGSFPEFYG